MPPGKNAKKDEKNDKAKPAKIKKFPKGILLSQYPLIRAAQMNWEALAGTRQAIRTHRARQEDTPAAAARAQRIIQNPHSKAHRIGRGVSFTWDDNKDTPSAPFCLNTPRDMDLNLTDTTGKVWTLPCPQRHQRNNAEFWAVKENITKINKWWWQIIDRRLGMNRTQDRRKIPWTMPEKSFAEQWIENLMRNHRRRPHGKDWSALTDELNKNFAGKISKAGEMLAGKSNSKSKTSKDHTTAKSHIMSTRSRHAVWTQVKIWESTQQLISRLETELGIVGATVEGEAEGGDEDEDEDEDEDGDEDGDESSELNNVDVNMILDFIDNDPDDKPQLKPYRKDGEGPDGDGGGLGGNIGVVMASGIVT